MGVVGGLGKVVALEEGVIDNLLAVRVLAGTVAVIVVVAVAVAVAVIVIIIIVVVAVVVVGALCAGGLGHHGCRVGARFESWTRRGGGGGGGDGGRLAAQ